MLTSGLNRTMPLVTPTLSQRSVPQTQCGSSRVVSDSECQRLIPAAEAPGAPVWFVNSTARLPSVVLPLSLPSPSVQVMACHGEIIGCHTTVISSRNCLQALDWWQLPYLWWVADSNYQTLYHSREEKLSEAAFMRVKMRFCFWPQWIMFIGNLSFKGSSGFKRNISHTYPSNLHSRDERRK